MKTKLILDVNKVQHAQLNSIVTGRVGDKASNTVDVYVVDGFIPYNLTGSDVYFECAKPDNTSVRDKNGITMIDAAKGHFEYTFPTQTFASVGKSKQAYFTVEKNSTVKATTQDFIIVSLPDALTNRIPSKTYISQLDELIKQLEQMQLDVLNSEAYREAHDAKEFAEQANELSNSIQKQLDTIVINGDSSVEAAQARVDIDNYVYANLKERIDADQNKIKILNEKIFSVTSYEKLKVVSGSGWDYRPSIQRALLDCEAAGGGIVHFSKLYNISSAIKVPSNITLIGRQGSGIKLLTGARGKIIINSDTINGNTNINIIGLSIEGNPIDGLEQDAGIHLVSCSNSSIMKNDIKNIKGDGITLGNITSGVIGTCSNVTVSHNIIDNAGRMGIALTDAKECKILYNSIKNMSNAPLDMGIAIDLEPNFDGQYCQDNIVEGNHIGNCKGGIYLAARENVTAVKGNKINYNFIRNITTEHGILTAYSQTEVVGNKLENIAKHGIYAGTGGVVQTNEMRIEDNRIIDASASSNAGYSCIRLENVVHSIIHDNIFRKSTGATNIAQYAFSEDSLSGYNSYKGNHARQIGIAYNVQSTSKVSHNVWNESAVNNVHEGFTALGDIKLNGTKLQIGLSSSTANIYHASSAPSSAIGVDNDIVFIIAPAVGTPVGYKKISGSWYPFGQVRYTTDISIAPTFAGQEALVSGVWYKAIGTSSAADWRKIT
ncbi:BppU family phage baseplate upper protein [Bacillus mycoides]|uniref:BppU family phage baseplate upper protein n=1 Tax=Bacillus mycoides TaxID=1405 RepID=UPI003D19DCED